MHEPTTKIQHWFQKQPDWLRYTFWTINAILFSIVIALSLITISNTPNPT